MRLFFATDLHGSEIVFRKFLNAIEVYEADVAILGGDLTGKRIVPIVETNGGFVAEVAGRDVHVDSIAAIESLDAQIRDQGQYPLRVTPEELRALNENDEAVEERFVEECHAQVADWMARAAKRFRPLGIPLFVTGGNDDYLSIEHVLDEADYVVNAEGRVLELPNGVEMISTGYGNETPWHCPRDISEEELQAKIDGMASCLRGFSSAVFNLHVPPYGSGLDTCPKLDSSVSPPKPIVGEETAAGSVAVSGSIARFQPILSLHGHIHESRGICRIGRTTAINPGSEYGEGILRSAVIDIFDDGERIAPQLLSS
jgi:Icc-related predicted phosphoesterase